MLFSYDLCHLLKQDGAVLWCMGFQKAQDQGATILGGLSLIWYYLCLISVGVRALKI